MRFISWNVNGLRACVKKGFEEAFWGLDADFFCLQETKLQPGQIDLPLDAALGLGVPEHDTEGRVVTLEYPEFFLVTVYTPNSQDQLRRLPYRMAWEDAFREHLRSLAAHKSVVVCGDMNVAHQEIDIKNPDTNHFNPGFSDQEREKMTELLAAGFTDSFRYMHPDARDAYSWWSFRTAARERNVGWRIDHFLVSDDLRDRIQRAFICPEITGSDHCPVGLDLLW